MKTLNQLHRGKKEAHEPSTVGMSQQQQEQEQQRSKFASLPLLGQ
jgi:hypothetical protein